MAVRFDSSDSLDRALDGILAEFPVVKMHVEGPTEKVAARAITLRNRTNPSDEVHIYEFSQEMAVHFGTGLSVDFDATEGDVLDVENLVRTIISEGFTESVWIRNGKAVWADATIHSAGKVHRARTATLLGKLGSLRTQVHHNAW